MAKQDLERQLDAPWTGRPVGIVQLDSRNGELAEAVYENHLSVASRPEEALGSATLKARHYAESHMKGFRVLSARAPQRFDHGSWVECRFVWQTRQGGAWLPWRAAVGVNARARAAAYFAGHRVPAARTPAARLSAVQPATSRCGRLPPDRTRHLSPTRGGSTSWSSLAARSSSVPSRRTAP